MTEYIVIEGKTFSYKITRKKVKNINLRVSASGIINVSAPRSTPLPQIIAFVQGKAHWLQKALLHAQSAPAPVPAACPYTHAQCMQVFVPLAEKYYPLFAQILQNQMPLITTRAMKSRWGVCYVQKRKITFNRFLLDKPLPAIEYVVLHEFCHFVHPNHQAGFHALMAQLMPDYKQRRALLR
ncbi:MAG: M48 family metallopeptidase [Oscillospiraceae bacterium]|nr:M48 family metallopeptidase [Oscillospiraceae bacterium]